MLPQDPPARRVWPTGWLHRILEPSQSPVRRSPKLGTAERIAVTAILLLAWMLRWIALMDVPPGWRDDDLIELYTFSLRIAHEGPQLYFAGASGHEPLYHTLRAPLVAIAGVNQASARWMSATFGLLTVTLTWAVGRRIFGRGTGLLGSAFVAVALWALMYSRVAIRHMGALPWMLLAIYCGWRYLHGLRPRRAAVIGLALGLAGALLTYYAGRLMPVFLVAAYPLAAPRRSRWRGYGLGILIGLLLAAPMFWAATRVPGGDARVTEVAVPLVALRSGDLRPLLQTVWTTLGMAHATGDPEWLYNYSGRPIFGTLGATLFYLSLAITVLRWRHPASRWLLLWLVVGISPAFISLPPSSYGHTIMALPAVYISFATLPQRLGELLQRREAARAVIIGPIIAAITLLAIVATRDLPAYFITWPAHSMVRFLYRADYRALVRFLQEQPEVDSAAVGSMLNGPWDKLAVQTDLITDTPALRWINPERALVYIEGKSMPLYLQDEGNRHPQIATRLEAARAIDAPEGMQGYSLDPPVIPDEVTTDAAGEQLADQPFEDALALEAVVWRSGTSEHALIAETWWRVTGNLPLPEEKLVPHPPPPGVYSGPRLKVFAHIVTEEAVVGIDDGWWVDPYSLRRGDRILQIHEFVLEETPPVPLFLQLGLYDPLTGTRWVTHSGKDTLTLTVAMP